MNTMHKLSIALFVILGIQGSAFAYRFSFVNDTSEDISLRFLLAVDFNNYHDFVVPANDSHELWFKSQEDAMAQGKSFEYAKGKYCWESIQINRNGVWQPVTINSISKSRCNNGTFTFKNSKADSTVIQATWKHDSRG